MTRVLKGLALAMILMASALSAACVQQRVNVSDNDGGTSASNPFTGPSGNVAAKVQIYNAASGLIQGPATSLIVEGQCDGPRLNLTSTQFRRNTNYVARLVAQGSGSGTLLLNPTTSGPNPLPAGTRTCNGVGVSMNGGYCDAAFNTQGGGDVVLDAKVFADNGGSRSCRAVVQVP